MKGISFKLCSILIVSLSAGILFSTCEKPERIVKLSTLEAVEADISYTSVKLKGEVTDPGSKAIEDHGILLSENSTPRVGNARVESLGPLNSKGIFQVQVTGLTKNTTYYFRAFVTVDGTDIYADKIISFKTKDTQAATVTAGTISNITKTSANLNGEVTADGGETVIKRGLCWGATANPTITNCLDTTINGSGTGTFTGLIHGLTTGTQYYVRAYAINAKATSYNSSDIVFTTHSLPAAATDAANPVLNTTATLNGKVNANSLSTAVTFEYGTTTSYGQTITATQSPVTGSTLTNVSASISGLTEGVTYNFRVNAVSAAGPVNGDNMTFTTLETPTGETKPASSITGTSVTLNGLVNAKNSSATVTFEYGPTTSYGTTVTAAQSPVTGNSAIPVTYNLTGLTPGATYHFRVRASSAGGTADGSDQPFTLLLPPEVVTGTTDNITSTMALLHGTVNARNSSTTVTFEYGPTTSYGTTVTATQSPVTGNTVTDVSAAISGLSSSTTYHYRIQGVSAGGTVNGYDSVFKTNDPPPSVTDYDGNTYNIIQVGSQYVTQENIRVKHFSNGDPILWEGVWTNLTEPGYCYVKGSDSYTSLYGYFYNYYSVIDPRNVCPSGWHVPTWGEWDTFFNTLGGSSVAGGKMKETGTVNWISPNLGASNSSGFTGRPGGYRHGGWTASPQGWGQYLYFGYVGVYWVADRIAHTSMTLGYDIESIIDYFGMDYTSGASIRCFKGSVPIVVPLTGTQVTTTSGTLNGSVNPNGLPTTVEFIYGENTSFNITVPASQGTITGNTPVAVSLNLTGLLPGTPYYYKIKATNADGVTISNNGAIMTNSPVTDADGNVYDVVLIGNQKWMTENLKTTRYKDGTSITNITDGGNWGSIGSGAYCWYDNDASTNKNTYGALYNYFAVADPKGLCPGGWHVPSQSEFTTLIDYLGGQAVAGGKMKETGTLHWSSTYPGVTNESGFTSLPAGYRYTNGQFNGIRNAGYNWSSTLSAPGSSWYLDLQPSYLNAFLNNDNNASGKSVRCLKD